MFIHLLSVLVSFVVLRGTAAFVHVRRQAPQLSNATVVNTTSSPLSWSPPVYNSTFEQPIDHWDANAGSFSQRYWFNSEFWGGPGYPIIFTTPGEVSGDIDASSLSAAYLWGMYAQEIKAAMVLVEHRYWGESIPFDVLDAHALQYLTIEQAVADFARFAELVVLPFDPNQTSSPQKAPWLFVAGSYAGMLAAWTGRFNPGLFWAFHAISAPVQVIPDFWQYWFPVMEGLPQNCSQDLQRIVSHVDGILTSENQSAIAELKDFFGLADLEDNGDFAVALEGYLTSYEQIQPWGGLSFLVTQMCDAIEGASGTNTTNSPIPASGVGLQAALANYAAWFRDEFIPFECGSEDGAACFGTYKQSNAEYTDVNYSGEEYRQWMWLSCHEPTFWSFKVAPPCSQPSIVSRLVSKEYYEGLCARFFPPTEGYRYGPASGRTANSLNALTGGWDYTNTTRLIWSNGVNDPWRTESVSSQFRPGGPLNSTEETPVLLIPNAWHMTDVYELNGLFDPEILAVQEQEVEIIAAWVNEFYTQKNRTANAKRRKGDLFQLE